MKKYDYYILAYEMGEESFEGYKDACSAYHKAESPKTLYGVNVEEGRYSVIFSTK